MRAVLAAVVLSLAACGEKAPMRFESLSVTLPQDAATFPDGPGGDAMTANCGACHSPSMILNQPSLKPEQWKATIKKMREVYKAPIDPAAEPAILAYLEGVSARIDQGSVASK